MGDLNDLEALERALAPGDVAAVLCEPALTNCGLVLPAAGFLWALERVIHLRVAHPWLLFLLPSMFVGIVSPILTKLAVEASPQQAGRAIGRMYALGALGSIAGTLAALANIWGAQRYASVATADPKTPAGLETAFTG